MVPKKNILLIKLEMIFITFGDSVDPQPHQKYWTQCDQNLDFADRAESWDGKAKELGQRHRNHNLRLQLRSSSSSSFFFFFGNCIIWAGWEPSWQTADWKEWNDNLLEYMDTVRKDEAPLLLYAQKIQTQAELNF